MLAFDQQQVAAVEDFVAMWHDCQLAVTKDSDHAKVENIGEAAFLERGFRQVAVLR